MRLRLTVQRNALPAAKLLWNVPETNSTQAYTISRLLEDVNHIIPLEAEHWGLEHYVVEVGGFECLHFSPVSQALKDDDQVCIRPLMTAEERARTLTGRHQISDDGRHLVDGVPFGRPYLRHPNRPAVRIPPRKRQRLDDETADNDAATAKRQRLQNIQPGDDHDDDAAIVVRELLGNIRPDDHNTAAQQKLATKINSRVEERSQARRAHKKVQFEQPEAPPEDSDSDDSEDGDFEDADMEDDLDSDSDSDTSSASDTSSSDSDSEDTSSDSDSDSDASSPPELRSSKNGLKKSAGTESPAHVAPGQGRTSTRTRNARRTRVNRLRHLKEAGKLGPDANLKDLAAYEGGQNQEAEEEPALGQPIDGSTQIHGDDDEAGAAELERRKRELMARFGDATASTMVQVAAVSAVASPKPPQDHEPPSEKETPRKRLRPDTSAIGRILARQAMPSAKKSKKVKTVVEATSEPEDASDPDFWKSRINLSAFECWEEEFELTAPPYPFKQHWDPASKLMRQKVEERKQKKGNKNKRSPPPQQDDEEEKIILDYDDVPANENPDLATAAAIEDQLRQDVETAAQADLPPLPDDVATLPDLIPNNIKEGAVIVCKFFAVNPITVTPEISGYKTAVVDREGDSGNGAGTIRLKLAQRDLPKKSKKFDSNGNRIYDAADQFFMEDEDEEEGLWEGQFSELIEPKLLKSA